MCFVCAGLASILPLELFQLFDSAELETLFCGTDDVSVDFLRSVTEYEGVAPTDPHITMFWCDGLLPHCRFFLSVTIGWMVWIPGKYCPSSRQVNDRSSFDLCGLALAFHHLLLTSQHPSNFK